MFVIVAELALSQAVCHFGHCATIVVVDVISWLMLLVVIQFNVVMVDVFPREVRWLIIVLVQSAECFSVNG